MIRTFLPDDLAVLKEITAICFDGVSIDQGIETQMGLLGGHDWRWRKVKDLDADVAGERAQSVFVYEVESVVAGYITSKVDDETKIGWIHNLAVLPAYQGRGIGRQLIETALDHFRQRGMECAKIETLAQNPVGTKLYPSFGFQEVARQIHYAMSLKS
jgi:ribosomal protein S18 acetylase RimI-like enzyme